MTFNGIDGSTGDYLLPPMSTKDISTLAQGKLLDPQLLRELQWKYRQSIESHYGVAEGVDPKNLADTGWGVIFAHNADPAIRDALSELLVHRRAQAAQKREHYYKEYRGAAAYRPGESKQDFLARHGAGPGPADPENVPYYLLIVGAPSTIPYRFQYQLDVQYGVGRLYFETPDEYARYAHSVVLAERRESSPTPRAAFWGVHHPGDPATAMSAAELVAPLARSVKQAHPSWEVQTIVGDGARKSQLADLLGGNQTPSLLFTASHGLGFPCGHARQLSAQGALLCQDWPGPTEWRKPIPQDHYFAADDVAGDAQLQGLISVHFACYSAGTPQFDEFSRASSTTAGAIAPHAFLARLPQRLLGHRNGGSLAAIGHVERAWGYSIVWPGAGRQIGVFESVIKRLMDGYPVGSATEYFNCRYAELSTDLSAALEDIKFGKMPDDAQLSRMWTANNDARNYSVIGDPAVHLG